jgi:hypothetical protein
MTIENLPVFFKMPYTNSKGRLTQQANTYNDQTFQTLNNLVNLVNQFIGNGYIGVPQATTAQIGAALPTAPLGAIWFNTDISQWQGLQAPGLIKTFTVT